MCVLDSINTDTDVLVTQGFKEKSFYFIAISLWIWLKTNMWTALNKWSELGKKAALLVTLPHDWEDALPYWITVRQSSKSHYLWAWSQFLSKDESWMQEIMLKINMLLYGSHRQSMGLVRSNRGQSVVWLQLYYLNSPETTKSLSSVPLLPSRWLSRVNGYQNGPCVFPIKSVKRGRRFLLLIVGDRPLFVLRKV